MDGKKKAELVKSMHKSIKEQIERKNAAYEKAANRKRKQVCFASSDLVWIHLRKERFPNQRKSKLMPRADGPFRVVEKVNDNAYKIELPGDYNVSATFNVRDLSPYLEDSLDDGEDLDLRANPTQQGRNDVHHHEERDDHMSYTDPRAKLMTLLTCVEA